MLEDIERINRLAENLKKTGLAASMDDAIDIAKRILNKEKENSERSARLEVSKESESYDVSKEDKTVKELLKEEKKVESDEQVDEIKGKKNATLSDFDESHDDKTE